MRQPASMTAARSLVRTECREPGRLDEVCARLAGNPAAAGAVIGSLAFVVIVETTGQPFVSRGPITLEVRRYPENVVRDIDDVDQYTRACARIIACLAGADLDTAAAVVGSFVHDADDAAALLALMTRYAHAAVHRTTGPPVVTFTRVDAGHHETGTPTVGGSNATGNI